MKITNLLFAALAIGLLSLSLTACKKEVKPEMKVGDVTIDLQKIYDLENGTSQEVKANTAQLQSFLRYRQYVQALATLDKISSDPSLNPTQKKEADELIGQVKQLAQSAPAQ